MTLHVAITGTDGSGKTTIVRRLRERFAGRPDLVYAFRAPQYHEDPDLPFGRLSAAIDGLSVQADRQGDPRLKATALFLSMTLYGDVEAHVARAHRPRVLVAERQCLADSLTYAKFYLPLLQGDLDPALAVDPAIAAWLPVLHARLGTAGPFHELPARIRDLFTSEDLLARLQTAYQAQIPDVVIHLTVPPDQLPARLAAKLGAATEVPRELHERAGILAAFQEGLAASCALLQRHRSDLRIVSLPTGDRTIDETETSVVAALGIEI